MSIISDLFASLSKSTAGVAKNLEDLSEALADLTKSPETPGLDALVSAPIPPYYPAPPREWGRTAEGRWNMFDSPRLVSYTLPESEERRFPSLYQDPRPEDFSPSSDCQYMHECTLSTLTLKRAKSIAQPGARFVLDRALFWRPINTSSEWGVLFCVEALRERGYSTYLWAGALEIETTADNVIRANLVWVRDKSQPKEYVLAVSPDAQTAKEAIARTWGIDDERLFTPSQHT